MISYGKQSIDQSDIDAIVDVLKSDFLTQGPKSIEFENGLSAYCGAKHVKVVSSGTAALHLAYLAIGLSEGDVVWTVPNTFVATANAALYCGAEVDFVDIDPKTYNLSIKALKKKLIQAKKTNNLPNLVVPVHFSGQSCNMKEIWSLSQEYGFKVIEDASHALGGEYLGHKVGSCKYSHMSVFSFHPVKMITTGEGGAVLTNDKDLSDRVAILMNHGITKDGNCFQNRCHDGWYYEQQDLGFNYRLTDIQAALGISQLKRLDNFIVRRRELAKRYLNELNCLALPYQHPDTNSSWHLFVVQVNDRKRVWQKLAELGLGTQVHYIPIVNQPYYQNLGYRVSHYPATKRYYQHALSIPLYYDLNDADQELIISTVNSFHA